MIPEILREHLLQSGVWASAALLAALFTIRFLVGRALKRGEGFPPLVVRRWTASLRNVLILIAIVGLVMIWAPQLRTFALSLTAFAVASVIAMKELIMCFSGSALRTLSRAYSVGDYIEIGGKRGEVMDFNLLVTRLREFEKQDGSFNRTGTEIIVPHSLLLSTPVRVEGHAGRRVRHVFTMTFEPDANLFAARGEIEEAALAAYTGIAAGDSKRQPRASTGLETQSNPLPALTVSARTSDIGKYRLEIAFYSKPELVDEVERAIASGIGDRVHNLRTENKNAGRKES
ncbi:mechanosensitive ion channel family protein [Sphingomonas flavalba]|uniref:mechanosensitive ion channel family protein n=1 Tax=Sphingomonas flavalba TaxID=2559804 RepID=UPI0039E1F020